MFKIKTPHRRPFRHLLNLFGLFVLGTVATVGLHVGAETGAFFSLAFAATVATAAAISLVAGIVVTATLRRGFNLVQTGRLVQYTGFWLSSWLGLKLASYFFTAITLTAPALAGFVLFAIAFGLATALGEVPLRGRTWMPQASKKNAAKSANTPKDNSSGPDQKK